MRTIFKRLGRFRTADGDVLYGEFEEGQGLDSTVPVYKGEMPWDLESTDRTAVVTEILSPLPKVPIIYGIGLNYRQHIEEAKFPVPGYPTVFTKPPDSLTGPFDDIEVDQDCKNMDYEGELCVVIGKDCKGFQVGDNIQQYILGYTVGNDVSSRFWQMPERSGQQHGYAKSFDKFCPIGPVLVSTELINDPATLQLTTTVNGEQRQTTSTSDLLFDIPTIIQHLSRGTTLRKGTVIMTGTPSGVAAFMKPPKWLADGDVVEIGISKIGKIRNTMNIQS
ncbi:hypothetical protein LTR64_002281 [Lithohypha guttulata]|uniref:uncharacterized protein n=1 Tax=Lithohypha guttulata TaxID=1690604 RepID=UPI002DE10A22|nr:hypothetical protein LTR51_001492 [Lithohypha guttulata]